MVERTGVGRRGSDRARPVKAGAAGSGALTPVTADGRAIALPEELTPFHRGGDGTPLVLLHGFTMSWRAWLPVLPYLAAHHTVLAMTMAGHRGGPALLPDGQPGAVALADTLCAQLDELGLDTVHVAGNSLGGWTALELARRGRARSVVAISPGGSWRHRRDMQALLWKFRITLAALASERVRPLLMTGPARRAWLGRMARNPTASRPSTSPISSTTSWGAI